MEVKEIERKKRMVEKMKERLRQEKNEKVKKVSK